MKKILSDLIEKQRVLNGFLRSKKNSGPNGAYRLVPLITGKKVFLIVSNMGDWDHVSVSCPDLKDPRAYIPLAWADMCAVKDLIFNEWETVLQYHPQAANYVNIHNGVLHLWKPQNQIIPEPPKQFV